MSRFLTAPSAQSRLFGATPWYVANKPNPTRLKSFVLANPDELGLDFQIYVGRNTFLDVVSDNVGLGDKAVLALIASLHPGTVIYSYFTNAQLMQELAGK